MIEKTLTFVKAALPNQIIEIIKGNRKANYKLISYSQEGEDLVLNRIFGELKTGFFVDVGAHHPIRFSNTYFFYKKGWRGINIDAAPASMKAFKKIRPNDINLEIPISQTSEEMKYYIFNDSALNGFSKELSDSRNAAQNNFKIINTITLETKRLDEVLKKYLPKDQAIDFLTIDVEGLDLEVLKSNDWGLFRPRYILVEILKNNLEEIDSDPVYQFLKAQGYSFYAKCVKTCFFKLSDR